MTQEADYFSDTPMMQPGDPVSEVESILAQAEHGSSMDRVAAMFRAVQIQGAMIRELRREADRAKRAKPWWQSMTIVSSVIGYIPKFGILGIVGYLVWQGMSPESAVAQAQSMTLELVSILGLVGLDKVASAFAIAGRYRAKSQIK